MPWQVDYLRQCTAHEDQRRRKAGFGGCWSNASCEALLGPPAEVGDLDDPHGSPRWKQRALYDAMRDAHALAGAVRLARLSVHDLVDGHHLGAVIDGRAALNSMAPLALLEGRTVGS